MIELGNQARREGRPADAIKHFTEAIRHSRAELAVALKGLGQVERDQGQVDLAIAHYEEALALELTLGDYQCIAHTARHLGDMHVHQKRPKDAEPFFEEAMTLYRGDPETEPLNLANALRGYALLKQALGDVEATRASFKEARELYAELGIDAGVEECDRCLAAIR